MSSVSRLPDLGPQFETLVWDLDLGPPILDPDLGPQFGTPPFGTPIWDPYLGLLFGTPIWDPYFGP
jgi:hypothetical protein